MPLELQADALDLTKLIRPGDTVLWSQGPAEPLALTRAMVDQRSSIGRFRAFVGSAYSRTFDPAQADHIDFIGLGAVGQTRKLVESGALRIIPCHLSQLPAMISDGTLKIDVLLVTISGPGPSGFHSYGAVCSYLPEALRSARVVVAEINDQAPWTHSSETVDIEAITHVLHVSRPLIDVPSRSPSPDDLAIARNVASLVEDGATLQIGIGSLPDAILAELAHHRDLGLHSGTVGDGVVPLIEKGAITNARKAIDTGISVTGALFGTRSLYAYARANPAFRVEPVSYTHSLGRLARLTKFTTINSAIEVDLFGQVNAEMANGKYVGTIGGATDFVRATQVFEGGRSIVALSSRVGPTGPGRIVSALSSPFTTAARADADFVVTEYGVASLRGQTVDERARRLVRIAHPDDREALAAAQPRH